MNPKQKPDEPSQPPVTKLHQSGDVILSHNSQAIINDSAQPEPSSYRELLKKAFASVLFGYIVILPFGFILAWIGFSRFDIGSSAQSADAYQWTNNLAVLVFAVAGGIYFTKKTRLRSGMITFILAGVGAGIPFAVLPYTNLQKNVRAVSAYILAAVIFALLIVILTKLSFSKHKTLALSLVSTVLVLGFAYSNYYYSVHGSAIIRAQKIKSDANQLSKINFTIYGPNSTSGRTVERGFVSKELICNKSYQANLDLGSNSYLELSESNDRSQLSGPYGGICSTSTTDSLPSSIQLAQKSPNGRPVYIDPSSSENQMYRWASTQIGGTFITVQDVGGGINNHHSLDFYATFFDTLQPLSNSDLANINASISQ